MNGLRAREPQDASKSVYDAIQLELYSTSQDIGAKDVVRSFKSEKSQPGGPFLRFAVFVSLQKTTKRPYHIPLVLELRDTLPYERKICMGDHAHGDGDG